MTIARTDGQSEYDLEGAFLCNVDEEAEVLAFIVNENEWVHGEITDFYDIENFSSAEELYNTVVEDILENVDYEGEIREALYNLEDWEFESLELPEGYEGYKIEVYLRLPIDTESLEYLF